MEGDNSDAICPGTSTSSSASNHASGNERHLPECPPSPLSTSNHQPPSVGPDNDEFKTLSLLTESDVHAIWKKFENQAQCIFEAIYSMPMELQVRALMCLEEKASHFKWQICTRVIDAVGDLKPCGEREAVGGNGPSHSEPPSPYTSAMVSASPMTRGERETRRKQKCPSRQLTHPNKDNDQVDSMANMNDLCFSPRDVQHLDLNIPQSPFVDRMDSMHGIMQKEGANTPCPSSRIADIGDYEHLGNFKSKNGETSLDSDLENYLITKNSFTEPGQRSNSCSEKAGMLAASNTYIPKTPVYSYKPNITGTINSVSKGQESSSVTKSDKDARELSAGHNTTPSLASPYIARSPMPSPGNTSALNSVLQRLHQINKEAGASALTDMAAETNGLSDTQDFSPPPDFVVMPVASSPLLSAQALEAANNGVRAAQERAGERKKRGTYARYSPRDRAEIAKYAAEYGNSAAVHFFRERFPNLSDSTVRDFRNKYFSMAVEMGVENQQGPVPIIDGSDIQEIQTKKRGRPLVIGEELDAKIRSYLISLVSQGGKLSAQTIMVAAREIIKSYSPALLAENGGPLEVNKTFAQSVLHRILPPSPKKKKLEPIPYQPDQEQTVSQSESSMSLPMPSFPAEGYHDTLDFTENVNSASDIADQSQSLFDVNHQQVPPITYKAEQPLD